MRLLLFFILLGIYELFEASDFAGKDDVYNEEHLKMHLEDQMEIGDKKMTQDQERYHYFTMADSNGDGFIDGVEAIHHDHENGEHLASQSDNEIEEKVDGVLKSFDLDGNSVIDYSEYIKGIEREE
uniref:EF-hand domain-containing protein n=1 Tax=Meloidogyne enterolobii TaxID=390850 RepID=A0A6V7U431_MELEN|nr:unnamed protein product [Meloidogyne enterolobii]